MTILPDPPVAETQQAVADLRGTRRRRRLGDTEWGDLAYRVYTTTFFCLVVGIMLSGIVGDDHVTVRTAVRVAVDGPPWAGLLLSVALLAGVRSGSRGGPLALEAPDVQHLLLPPTNRTAVLRRPTVGTLGYGAATGVLVFGLVGSLMSQRLPGGATSWMACGALFGAVVTGSSLGAALLTCSRRVPRWILLLVGWGLVLWSVGDVTDKLPSAPTSFAGKLLFWPLRSGAQGIAWVAVALALAIAGAALIGGLSIEAARRRTQLVAQLRFAVTQQDLRSVALLRRQLASESPRNRTLFRIPRAMARRFPVATRDLESVAHWPAIRVMRVLVLAIGSALAIRGMWSGTTPLILVAGIAAFVAGLDATEPLAQEIDHPTLMESYPVHAGDLMLRHLVQPCIVTLVAGFVGLGVAWGVDPSPDVLRVGSVIVVTGALSAVAAAAVSIVSGTGSSGADMIMTPEVAGPRMVFRTAWPPLVAIIGFLPALAAARASADADPLGVAITAGVGVLILVSIVFTWVRYRPEIQRSMAEAMPGGSD